MNDEIKEQEKYAKLILELTDLDIKTNGKLNDIQRVQLDLYEKIYLLLKKVNLLREENNGVRKGFNQLQSNWNSLREWLEVNDRYSQGYFKQVLEYMNELEGE